MHCSCVGYVVILRENYNLLCAKSKLKLKGQIETGM